MEFISIFQSQDNGLFSVQYEGIDTDEFDMLFDHWQDLEFLEDFFDTNSKDLKSSFYNPITVDEAIFRTRADAKALQSEIMNIHTLKKNRKYENLDRLFVPLRKVIKSGTDLEHHKAYGVFEKSWIRLYALKLENNFYIITGGCIKLTNLMDERSHTQKELEKLNRCRDSLLQKGITDKEGFLSII